MPPTEPVVIYAIDANGEPRPLVVDNAGNLKIAGAGAGLAVNVAIADGGDATLGALGDAAVATDTTGTISGKLRGIVKHLAERIPAALGLNSALKVERPLQAVPISVDTTGAAGSATGTASSAALYGGLLYVSLAYHASAPVTTIVSLADALGNIVTFPAGKTAMRRYVRVACYDSAGLQISGLYEIPVLYGAVTVSVTACDQLTAAVVATLVCTAP